MNYLFLAEYQLGLAPRMLILNMALPYKIVILKIYHIMEKIKENVQIKNERSKIHIFHEVQNAISFP